MLEANVQHNDGHILQIIDPIVPCQTSGDYYQRWRRQRRPLPHVEQLCTCTSQQRNVKCTKESYVCKLCANCVQTSCVQTGVQNGVRQTILAKLFALCITRCRTTALTMTATQRTHVVHVWRRTMHVKPGSGYCLTFLTSQERAQCSCGYNEAQRFNAALQRIAELLLHSG